MKPGMALLKSSKPDDGWFMRFTSVEKGLAISHRRVKQKTIALRAMVFEFGAADLQE
jgi:hypothetical protein